jgi:hypothetical protein
LDLPASTPSVKAINAFQEHFPTASKASSSMPLQQSLADDGIVTCQGSYKQFSASCLTLLNESRQTSLIT